MNSGSVIPFWYCASVYFTFPELSFTTCTPSRILEPLSPPWIPRAKISHQSCTFWGWEIYPPLALMGNNPGMEYQAQEQPLHKGIAPPIKIMVWRLPCPCLMQFFVVVFASTRMTQSTMDLCIRDTNYIKNGTKKFHVYFTSSKTARIVI